LKPVLGCITHDSRNRALTSGYIWTAQAVNGYVPSVTLLEKVRDAFLSEFNPNRFVIRATYGHGKSHLALAMANFFGKPADSPEVVNLLDNLSHSATGKAPMFRVFKTAHAPFLVLRLRGDDMQNLPQQVVSGLETALREQEATRDADLGLWFDKALVVLDRMGEEQGTRAGAFLSSRGYDVPTLRQRLIERDGSVYELCHSAIEDATGVPPDFGRAVEPGAAIEHVCDQWCGEGKPFAGLLVLFDEFSLFVEDYAKMRAALHGAPLQSLLDGIYNRRGKAAFVAFSQQDPDDNANLIFRRMGAGEEELQRVLKELTRLEKGHRYWLYSSMETVLDAYLKQDEKAWGQLMENERLFEAVIDASDEVGRLFEARYGDGMKEWGAERVQKVLAEGCFPLHPLTTAILCSVPLRATDNTRSVMGFVLDALDRKVHEPAACDGVPNWVYATELVEWFKEWLAEDEESWKQYRESVKRASEEAPDEHKTVLSAMLLHEAAKLKVSRAEGDYERNLASLCGLSKSSCKAALKALHEAGYIRHDESRRVYTFWPMGESGDKVEKPLREETETIFRDPTRLRETLESSIKEWGWDDIEVGGMPGHPQDWAAEVWLLPRSLFTSERLKQLAGTYRLHKNNGLIEGRRGFVVRPIASNEEELAWLRANASAVLDEALSDFGDAPPPLVIERPFHVQPNFLKALVRERVLHSWDAEKKREVGAQAFSEVQKRVENDIQTEVDAFSGGDFVVPLAYRAAVQAAHIEGQRRNAENVLRDCYLQAYRYSPPGFFKNYRRDTNTNLKDAVSMACSYLVRGSMSGYDMAAKNKGTARELYSQFLAGGTSREQWGLVLPNGRVQEPQAARLREAWKVLDEAIPPGADEVPVSGALLKLLNAPYGYDYNTLSLLFCAWFGANHHQMTLTSERRPIHLEECFPAKADSKKFLENVCWTRNVHIARRDTVRETEEVDTLLRRIRLQDDFSLEEARTALGKLEAYAEDESADPARLQNVKNTVTQLAHETKLATDYSAALEKLAADVQGATNFPTAIKALHAISAPPPLGAVKPPAATSPGELREIARTRLRQMTDLTCARLEQMASLQGYDLQKTRLETIKSELEKAGEPEFTNRVDEALSQLNERLGELSSEGKDADFVSSLRAMKGEKRLATLRSYLSQLNTYQPHSEKTRGLMETARAEVEASLADALNWLETLPPRLREVLAPADVRRIAGEVQRRLDRYENTDESPFLDGILERCDTLEKYFEKLTSLRRERPESVKDLDKTNRRIETLTDDEELSEPQKELARNICAALEERTRADIEAAIRWLGENENLNTAGEDPIRLMAELDKGSPFLPIEYSIRLRSLKKVVQKRIDDDEVKRVEASFRNIKDKTKRDECLRILQAIMSEA